MSSSSIKYQFNMPARFRMWSLALLGIGVLSVIIGFFVYGMGDEHQNTRFWASLLQNSVYFLLTANAAMFFMCATTLAMGGFQMTFRRVSEAVSATVPALGIITSVILLILVWGHKHHIYHWTDQAAVNADEVLKGKSGFLNPTFFTVWTLLTVFLWIWLGHKMRQLSRETDNNPLPSVEAGRRYIFKNTVWASIYMVWFVLSVMSTVPWLWLMSVDAHWYSTMYSWYTFGSTFVAGIAVITLFVIYLKNQGYLELTNEEHLHDLGKFMFAFSIFWTYLWFAQYMLIWYANIPEETTYFKPRQQGEFRTIFFLNLIINFLAPFLIFMRRSSKRNYTTVAYVSALLVIGHWLDFYQMVFPGPMEGHVALGLFDIGVALGFIGLIMFLTGRSLEKHPLIAKNHPFIKESIIHHT